MWVIAGKSVELALKMVFPALLLIDEGIQWDFLVQEGFGCLDKGCDGVLGMGRREGANYDKLAKSKTAGEGRASPAIGTELSLKGGSMQLINNPPL